MGGIDYLTFRQTYRNSLIHSPKGTTWKDHKYIRKENKRYIYKELSKRVHSFARDVRDDMNESENTLKELSKKSKDPVIKTGESMIQAGEKAIKKLFDTDFIVKTYKISGEITDKGFEILDRILKGKR